MPAVRNSEPIRRRYSRDLRQRVIYQHVKLGRKSTRIAIELDMPLRVVQRTMQRWKEVGDVLDNPKKMRRAATMSPAHIEFLFAILERNPDLYLDKIAEELEAVHGVDVCLSTVWRTMKTLGFGSKKLSKAAAERCEEARAAFKFKIGAESPERLVFTDETAVDLRTTYRLYGWGYNGERARVRAKFVRGDRFSILPALTMDGIIYSHIKKGSFDGDAFISFIEGLLEHMNPYPSPQSVLVMDNCSIHHVFEVDEMCEARGVKLVYLPPYSPDFNPIEEAFSFLKAYIRRHGPEFRAAVEGDDNAMPYLFLYEALDEVKPDAAKGWMGHSGYM